MDKIISGISSQRDFFEPTYMPVFSEAFEKMAGDIYVPSTIVDYIAKLKPREDGRYVHIIALGAGEYWSANRKGDYFPEWSLLGQAPPPEVQAVLDKRGLKAPPEYGIKTFEKYAYTFRDHNNKSPRLTIGDLVACAAYNDKMKRVELIVFVSKEKAPDLVKRIDNNDPIPWSMGCKVNFDVCCICGNLAKTPGKYCEHAKHHLGEVYDDGRRVYVSNWFPKFFDISAVTVPADRSAWSLKKVASLNTNKPKVINMPGICAKQRRLSKVATIEKNTPPEFTEQVNLGKSPMPQKAYDKAKGLVSRDKTKNINPEVLKNLKRIFGKKDTIKSLTSAGVVLKPHEAKGLLGGCPMPHIPSLTGAPPGIMSMIKGLLPGRSMFGPRVGKRVMSISITVIPKNGQKKTGSVPAFDPEVRDYYKWLSTLNPEELCSGKFSMDINPDTAANDFQHKLASIYRENINESLIDWDFIMPFILELDKYLL